MQIDTSKLTVSGGWCPHGICEASFCEQCATHWRSLGYEYKYSEGDEEAFKEALKAIVDSRNKRNE